MKKTLLQILLTSLLSFYWNMGLGQGYRIDYKFGTIENANLMLGYYLNGKTYIQDTAVYHKKAKYTFQGESPLDKGLYFVAKDQNLLFNLVIGVDQTFELISETDTNYASTMKVVGDEENRLFFANSKFNNDQHVKGSTYLEIINDSTASMGAKEAAKKEIDLINLMVAKHQDSIIQHYPNSILSTLFKSGKRVQIPEEIVNNTDENAQMKKLHYYRNHYWDYFDLGDPMLLRLPKSIYKEKVDDYMDNLVHPKPDSVKQAADYLISLAKKTEETYQSIVWHLTLKYQSSKIMGLDEVYVHLVDTYFLTSEMDFWANDQLKKNLKEKADQYRNSLIGMVAPNLVLQDLEKKPKALHSMPNTYTVVYFYDPDCGHCKKETPVLKAVQDTISYDLGVYTVSADTSMAKMKKYIEEGGLEKWTNTNGTRSYGLKYQEEYDAFTTPTLYLLNERKEIIAKKLSSDQLSSFIRDYERAMKKEATKNQ